MLLKRICLVDFRQFVGKQEIEFSVDPEKNVTVIMGENGSGKTTFAQAFTWCMYGTTDFADPLVLCKATLQDMRPGDSKNVSVELKVEHKGQDYYILREQIYQLDNSGKLKRPSPTKLTIRYKSKDGQQEFIPEKIKDSKVKEILPEELSGYFFFDGERIGNMSKEIQSGKSKEFAEAVKKLLGLDTYLAALKHIKGARKNSVIGSYEEQYDAHSDSRIGEYGREIQSLQAQMDSKRTRIDELDTLIPQLQEEIQELRIKIEKNKGAEDLTREIKSLQAIIERNNDIIGNSTQNIVSSFQKNYRTYFYQKMITDVLQILVDADKLDKGIPDIHQRTIDYLIARGTCICGTPITSGDEHYQHLMNLLEYIPPQSLGTLINQFVEQCNYRVSSTVNIFESVRSNLADVAERVDENHDREIRISDIEEQLKGFADVGPLQTKLMAYNKDLREKNSEKSRLYKEIGGLQTRIDRCESERRNLSLKNENNRKIEIYKAYAEYIYLVLQNDYKEQEKKIRIELEACINEIFTSIYNGGMSLKIDDKYNIQTIVNDYKDFNVGVETSTAQSISIIFAFIAGVIKMARNNKDNEKLSTEPYPLVMDAPLSAFDKARIQTVCDTLPNIAEQVIIFIKDTDGEIAAKYLSEKIGADYIFDKHNEFETFLSKR